MHTSMALLCCAVAAAKSCFAARRLAVAEVEKLRATLFAKAAAAAFLYFLGVGDVGVDRCCYSEIHHPFQRRPFHVLWVRMEDCSCRRAAAPCLTVNTADADAGVVAADAEHGIAAAVAVDH